MYLGNTVLPDDYLILEHVPPLSGTRFEAIFKARVIYCIKNGPQLSTRKSPIFSTTIASNVHPIQVRHHRNIFSIQASKTATSGIITVVKLSLDEHIEEA